MTTGRSIEPGCLALVVEAHFPENKGRVCKVVELIAVSSQLNQPIWLVLFPRAVRVKQFGQTFLSLDAHVPQSWLRRIDGDEDLIGEDVDTVATDGIKETA